MLFYELLTMQCFINYSSILPIYYSTIYIFIYKILTFAGGDVLHPERGECWPSDVMTERSANTS